MIDRARRGASLVMMAAAIGCGGCGGSASSIGATGDSSAADARAEDAPGFSPDTSGFEAYVEPDTGPPWDARLGDAPPTTADCVSCDNLHCGALVKACYEDAVCPKQAQCRLDCSDEACASRCRELFPSTLYDAYMTCMVKYCAGACGL